MTNVDSKLESAPQLEWKSFLALTSSSIEIENVCKKDWERKADKGAQIIIIVEK